MTVLLIGGLFCATAVFIITKNSIGHILSMKFAADCTLLLFYRASKSQEELRSLGWVMFSLVMVTIFLMAVATLNKAVHRGLNE